MPEVHRQDIEWVQYRNYKRRFLSHRKDWMSSMLMIYSSVLTFGKVKQIIKYRLILDVWNHKEYLYQSYYDMYKSRYVLCSKCYEHIPEWFIRWSLDNSKDILMSFGRTKNISCISDK